MNVPTFKTVLIVDDEDIDIFLANKILENDKYCENMIYYNNGRHALHFLKTANLECRPDLILLDLNMPAFNGEAFLVAYHAEIPEEVRNTIKLVVLTAYKYYHEAEEINSVRFPSLAKILEKPLKIEELKD